MHRAGYVVFGAAFTMLLPHNGQDLVSGLHWHSLELARSAKLELARSAKCEIAHARVGRGAGAPESRGGEK